MTTAEVPVQILRKKELFFFHLALYIGAFLSHFTANIVNVALPTLSQIFHGQTNLVKWIAIGYMLTISVTLPLMGNVADRIGYRILHNMGYTLFTVGSVLIALSPNLIFLLIFRTLQAIGASMFQATNMALMTIHTPKNQRGRSIGLFSSAVAFGAMSGPVAGGFIIQWLDWNWLFWANVPFSVLAIYLSIKYIPKSITSQKSKPFDGMGIFLFACIIGTFIFGISLGEDWGWTSTKMVFLFLLTAISCCFFFLWEKKHPIPFIPYHLFQNPLIITSLLVILSAFLIANAALAAMPFYLSKIIQLPAYQIGYIIMIYPIMIAVIGPIAGYLSDHYGSKRFAAVGIICIFVSSFMIFVLQGQLSLFHIFLAFILFGAGIGFATSPTNRMIMDIIPKHFVGIIGGVLALLRNIGILLGSAISLAFITEYRSIPSSIFLIFAICSAISLTCLTGFGYAYWQNQRALSKNS